MQQRVQRSAKVSTKSCRCTVTMKGCMTALSFAILVSNELSSFNVFQRDLITILQIVSHICLPLFLAKNLIKRRQCVNVLMRQFAKCVESRRRVIIQSRGLKNYDSLGSLDTVNTVLKLIKKRSLFAQVFDTLSNIYLKMLEFSQLHFSRTQAFHSIEHSSRTINAVALQSLT